jgi:glycogen debranching enzyme
LIDPLLAHVVDSGCVGSISEIFDAEAPFTPRGCCAQAWSVAEVARLVVKLAAMTRDAGQPVAVGTSGHAERR